jgi:spermidine synthase
MKPLEILGESTAPDGTDMKLTRRDREYVILANGKTLMSSRMHGSEDEMARLACEKARRLEAPSILIGGLGMGFTLRATLDLVGPGALIVVSELIATVVEWNRGPLGELAGNPLDDARVRVDLNDVALTLDVEPGRFDAVMLDVDNGPTAFTTPENRRLYDAGGLGTTYAALKPGGVLAVWSAFPDRKFEQRLRYVGFSVEAVPVRARLKKGGPRHVIFLGRKP